MAKNLNGYFETLERIGFKQYSIEKKHTLTIDANNTFVFDDAYTIDVLDNGNFVLGIHVADMVLSNIMDFKKPYPVTNVDNFNYLFSLKKDEKRNAISLFIEFDLNQNILDYRLCKTVLRVNNNLKFKDVLPSLLATEDSKQKQFMENISALYTVLTKKKLNYANNPGMAICSTFNKNYNTLMRKALEQRNSSYIIYKSDSDGELFGIHGNGFSKNNKESFNVTSPIRRKDALINQFLISKIILENEIDIDNETLEEFLSKNVNLFNEKGRVLESLVIPEFVNLKKGKTLIAKNNNY